MKHNINVTVKVEGKTGSERSLVLRTIKAVIKQWPNSKVVDSPTDEHAFYFNALFYDVPIGKGRTCINCDSPMNTKGKYACAIDLDGAVTCSQCGTVHTS